MSEPAGRRLAEGQVLSTSQVGSSKKNEVVETLLLLPARFALVLAKLTVAQTFEDFSALPSQLIDLLLLVAQLLEPRKFALQRATLLVDRSLAQDLKRNSAEVIPVPRSWLCCRRAFSIC